MYSDPRQARYCYPPHPSPRKPVFELPPGTVDTHFHIFGPPEKFPWSDKRVYTPPAAPLDHFHKLMARLGVDRGVVVQPMAHGLDNAVTLDAIANSDGRLLGVAKIDDTVSDDDLNAMHDGGMRGARFNMIQASGGEVNLPMFERIADRIAALGWSITFHARPDEIVAHRDWFRTLELPVILDHFGRISFGDGTDQPAFQALLTLLREEGHIWAKLTCAERNTVEGPPYRDALPYAHAMVDIAPDRLIWGTDWPHSQRWEPGDMCDDGDLVDLVPEMIRDAGTRQAILVDNPARLFGFES